MAFDGITIACMVHELSEKLVGGRITKISQPEKEEVLLTVKRLSLPEHNKARTASSFYFCVSVASVDLFDGGE